MNVVSIVVSVECFQGFHAHFARKEFGRIED